MGPRAGVGISGGLHIPGPGQSHSGLWDLLGGGAAEALLDPWIKHSHSLLALPPPQFEYGGQGSDPADVAIQLTFLSK